MAKGVIIDAFATLGLFQRLPYSDKVKQWFRKQQQLKTQLVAPVLWEHECLTGLRRAVTFNMISTKDAIWMARQLLVLEVKRIIPTEELHSAALIWAERIGHSKTDDPHYLVLFENLAADFWTADSRLMNSVRELGIDWVYCFRGSMSI